ncbi:hypothetical protein GCM10009642_50140 [Nocardiopsis metallicus]
MPAEVVDNAGDLTPGRRRRSLAALHVCCARGLGAALSAFVTYDKRLAEAAEAASPPVVTPSPRTTGTRERGRPAGSAPSSSRRVRSGSRQAYTPSIRAGRAAS